MSTIFFFSLRENEGLSLMAIQWWGRTPKTKVIIILAGIRLVQNKKFVVLLRAPSQTDIFLTVECCIALAINFFCTHFYTVN